MSYTQYIKDVLAPLRIYDLEGTFVGGEVATEGEALDKVDGGLDEVLRESNLATAESWGLDRIAKLLVRRPVAADSAAMRGALAALLRINGDSFTRMAINDTLFGCGIRCQVDETDTPGTVLVYFPGVPGIPAGFEEMSRIIEDILPAHLLVEYSFWIITWAQLEERFQTWQAIENELLTWTQLECYVE